MSHKKLSPLLVVLAIIALFYLRVSFSDAQPKPSQKVDGYEKAFLVAYRNMKNKKYPPKSKNIEIYNIEINSNEKYYFVLFLPRKSIIIENLHKKNAEIYQRDINAIEMHYTISKKDYSIKGFTIGL